MSILHIEEPQRRGAHLLLAMYAESGGGKTYSAMKIAHGLAQALKAAGRGNGSVLFVDTENERGRIYANLAPHKYAVFSEPWEPARYIEVLDQVEHLDFSVCIIDSVSHEWDDVGGVLDMAEQTGAKGLLKWLGPKLAHKRFVKKLLRTRSHLILCMRAKEKTVEREIVDNGVKKKVLEKIGIVPIQAKDFIYDMTVQLRLFAREDNVKKGGYYAIEKCPEELWGAFDEASQLSEETGARIAQWVLGSDPVDEKFEAVKRAGEDAANRGVEALRAWFKALPTKKMRDRVLPLVEGNLLSVANAADRRREALAKAEAEERQGATERTLFHDDPQGDVFPGDRPSPVSGRPAYLDALLDRLRGAATFDQLHTIDHEGTAALLNANAPVAAQDEFRKVMRDRAGELMAAEREQSRDD